MCVEAGDHLSKAPDRFNGRAAVVVSLAFCLLSATDALVELLAQSYAVPQVTFMITAAALAIIIAQGAFNRNAASLLPLHPPLAIVRALLLSADTLLIHYAFSVLPLADAYILAFLTPVIVAVLAYPFLGERVSKLAWTGVLLGFVGVAVALRPGTASFSLGHAAAVGSAFVFAVSLVMLRRARAAESDQALVATLLVVLTVTSLTFAALNGGLSLVNLRDLSLAIVAGACMYCGHMLLVRAFRIGDASVVAPFQYSQIVW